MGIWFLKKIKMSCEDDRMCEEVTRCCPMRNFLLFLVLPGIFFLFLPETALAKENIVKQDSDKDGNIDRITYFDGAGKISKLEVDSNGDGRFDTVYHFQEGRLFSCTRDTGG
jgi:hypothetical protein